MSITAVLNKRITPMKYSIRLTPLPLCVIALVSPLQIHSAPGELADEPLFLGSSTQPNILFLVDDSGSMDWEVLQSTGARAAYPTFPDSGNLDITPTRNDRDEMLESCAGYNVMYYNPDITYTPWIGVDANGDPYEDQVITNALVDPYFPTGTRRDLTDDEGFGDPPGYFVWDDADDDGEFDQGECPDPDAADYDYEGTFLATVSGFGPAEMSDADKANFANWYTYYRKREYVVKRSLSEIITDATGRVGLATLHNNSSVGTIIEDVDDITTPIDLTAQTNKLNLLSNLYQINSSGSTPLRSTLEQAGDYFEVGVDPGTGLFGFTPSPTSPILSDAAGGACQQNFTVMLTDGFWNGSSPNVGNTDEDGIGVFDGGSHADTASNTLADVAMDFYERDLAPSLDNVVPVTAGVDENSSQHMVTYTVAFGIDGSLEDNPADRDTAFIWPTPVSDTDSTIDDVRHAAWNGRGEYLSAQNPQELIDSLSDSINSIQARTGSASAVAFNTTSITADTFVYQARFDSGEWSGTIQAFEFDGAGVGAPAWDAGELLADDSLDWEKRAIYTYRTDTDEGIIFAFPENYHSRLPSAPDDEFLSADQINDLLTNAPFSSTTADSDERSSNQLYGENIVDFFRGDYSFDGNQFRSRSNTRLGDIVHSSPEFVGMPSEPYPNLIEGIDNLYSDFIEANESRRGVVYVGANDGMLHAFDATTGEELFAYIPGAVFDTSGDRGLHKLSEIEYNHLAYVDGSAVSRDVFVNGAWETFLVGSMRAGGKSVFVLDVTEPDAYTTATTSAADTLPVMEFTDDDLGFTFSTPQIARMNNGKWAAIFGNGYNSDPSGDGTAKLFILFLDGSGFEVLETNVGSINASDCEDAASDCNGLSSPSLIDINDDFSVDRIYAGDLHGNIWVFDVSSNLTTNWGSAFNNGSDPAPLFTACSATPCTAANRQPITSKPIAIGHPTISSPVTFPNVLVVFGTGQYIATNDNSDTSQQSFYGVWDAGSNYDEFDRSNLVEQQIIEAPSSTGNVAGGRTLSENQVSYSAAAGKVGWFLDLPTSGERVVVDPVSTSGFVFFNTTIPESTVCSAGGSGFIMVADLRTGGQPTDQVFTALDDGSNMIDISGVYAGIPIDAIPGGGTIIDGSTIVISDSLGRIVSTDFNPGDLNINSRRAVWSVVK